MSLFKKRFKTAEIGQFTVLSSVVMAADTTDQLLGESTLSGKPLFFHLSILFVWMSQEYLRRISGAAGAIKAGLDESREFFFQFLSGDMASYEARYRELLDPKMVSWSEYVVDPEERNYFTRELQLTRGMETQDQLVCKRSGLAKILFARRVAQFQECGLGGQGPLAILVLRHWTGERSRWPFLSHLMQAIAHFDREMARLPGDVRLE